MAEVKIELLLPGINEMMKSPEIQKQLQMAGEAVAEKARDMAGGEPFEASTHLASWVAITNVYPKSAAAARSNYRDNTILKAVNAVGLPTHK